MTSEQYCWLLVDGFVEMFNEYRKNYFIPSHTICVDASISQWYGQGGFWINIGIPMQARKWLRNSECSMQQ
jgi:hypothetical protein